MVRYIFCVTSLKPYQQSLDDGVSVFALIVNHFYVIQVGISPVHKPVHQIQSDTVREDNFTVHQLCAVLSIHVTAFHPWRRPVVGKKQFAVEDE